MEYVVPLVFAGVLVLVLLVSWATRRARSPIPQVTDLSPTAPECVESNMTAPALAESAEPLTHVEFGRLVAGPAPDAPQRDDAHFANVAPATPRPEGEYSRLKELAEELDARLWNMRIAGTSHQNEDGTSRGPRVLRLARGEELNLQRDRDNLYSNHAVRVFDDAGYGLGFVPEEMARAIAAVLDGGGFARAFVSSVRLQETGFIEAWIVVLYRAKLSPRAEFKRFLTAKLKGQVDEWFWASLSRLDAINTDGRSRQDLIRELRPYEQVQVQVIGDPALDVRLM